MTSEALFGLSILMNLVAWGIVALLFIWPRTGHRSLEMLKPTAATPKHSSVTPARDCSE
jgi:hypothetical protein